MAEAVIFNPVDLLLMQNDKAASRPVHSHSSVLFESVFKEYYKSLYLYACSILKDETTAEEIVQQVFYKLWEKKEQIEVQQSIKSYLYRAVHNESINYLRHEKVVAKYQSHLAYSRPDEDRINDKVALKELQQNIDMALNELPEQCRAIFQLSRYEELNYREIADTLGVSVSTVKNQVGKALRVLRTKLADFLPAVIFLIMNIKLIS